jgi:hypothetical protein
MSEQLNAWEYRIVTMLKESHDRSRQSDAWENRASELLGAGRDGWEAVSFTNDTLTFTILLKRRILN